MTKRIDRSLLAQQVAPLLMLLAELEPALETDTVITALREAAALPDGQRRIAQEVSDRPELLTGQGASAARPGVLRFIHALVRAGAATVVEPSCARCGRQRKLGRSFNGLRLCANCTRRAVAMPCGRCGKVRPPARRNDNGQAICQPCWWRDPRSWKTCAGCGDQRRVAVITEAGPICTRCRPRPEVLCGVCGRTGKGGISRATGQPMCDRCRERWAQCSRCGASASLKGGTLDEPLCARCVNPDPAFWQRCGTCGITWQLTPAECARCSLDRKLREIFTAADGASSSQLDQLREVLVQVDRPDHAMDWLNKTDVRTTLHAVASSRHTITHEALDAMPPSGTLAHLRSMLVAADALPSRDELLAALERWIDQAVAERKLSEHQRVLHGYAVWHHLRRLRGRLDGQPASHQQVKNIRRHVADAVAFLDWLDTRGLTLASCTQTELDQWLAGSPRQASRSANFVRWAITHRHASRLTAPATRWTGPSGPLDQDRRWADARRLLHDNTCPVADRVAGLLILLYAQKLSAISTLTTQQVRNEEGRTLLVLGSRPIVLPAPLDSLVNELANTRRTPGSGLIDVPSTWLFPGRWPGRPLTEEALARRLRALGLSPRQSRNTALFTLATEVPAAILAKTLGIHIKAATQWQKISNGDWTAYAADISKRTTTPDTKHSNSSNS
ncbi:MAG: site-specific integrase [Rhodococcus sp. (in: high G+C Gram-positive bacteria)]|nr:MAG: site-specific integrase [Rhodococcus sp. (in: high G+C Gram-positive bacteria)]